MGYYTDFYLQATPVTEDQFHSIDSALQELRSMRERTLMMEPGTGRTLKIPGIRALMIWSKYPGISPK